MAMAGSSGSEDERVNLTSINSSTPRKKVTFCSLSPLLLHRRMGPTDRVDAKGVDIEAALKKVQIGSRKPDMSELVERAKVRHSLYWQLFSHFG